MKGGGELQAAAGGINILFIATQLQPPRKEAIAVHAPRAADTYHIGVIATVYCWSLYSSVVRDLSRIHEHKIDLKHLKTN